MECCFRRKGYDGISTYIDAPEFLNGVECHDFFEQIIPVITLYGPASQHLSLLRLDGGVLLPCHWEVW
jgi:hypothetical protein